MSVRSLAVLFASLTLLLGAPGARAQERPVILVGIDGFRADYLDRG